MRDLYHDELDDIGNSLVAMTYLAGTAMERATNALLDGDLNGAERVVSDDTAIDALRADLESRTFSLLSLQQPVATDLRVLVTTLHLVADLERMGDLALHVAKVARMRYPDIAVPTELRDVISPDGRGGAVPGGEGGRGDQGPRRRAGPGDRGRGRLDGRAAPQAVHPVAVGQLDARHRGRHRHDAARPLLRALRRPRGRGGPPDRVHRHRADAGRFGRDHGRPPDS